MSCTTTPNPNPAREVSHWILYEFQEPHAIDTTWVWNANRTGESDWGLQYVLIDYSPDGTTWEELGQFAWPKAPETDDYEGFEGPNFNGVVLEKILITVVDTYGGGNCASLAEIQFNIDPDACIGAVSYTHLTLPTICSV